jgi:hypothetical protein
LENRITDLRLPVGSSARFRALSGRASDIDFSYNLLFSMDRFHTEHSTRVCRFTLTVSCDNLRESCYRIQPEGTGFCRIMPDSVMLLQLPAVLWAILFAKIF